MAGTGKRRNANKANAETLPKEDRQAPKERVIEAGREEQDDLTARQKAARKKEREAYRHSGIPIGSDPRE
jgi:hypothetical protein